MIAALAFLVFLLFYKKEKAEAPSSIVKDMIFSDFHYTETVGDALRNFDPDGEWIDISEKNALKNTGKAYAAWKGTCKSSGVFTETENWDFIIYFEVEQVDEGYYVSVDQVEFGNYRLISSNLLQKSSIWEIMNMIYGNQNSVSVSADAGLFSVTYFLSQKDPTLRTPTGESLPSSIGNDAATVTTPPPELIPAPIPPTETENRAGWDYEDYVEHYGFDPSDYGYYWYNEIKSGPLDDFFEGIAELVGGTSSSSRLYEDAWITNLTWSDFVGTWQTESGITFTIDCMGDNGIIEDYTIDLSGNDLGILGGWFSENIYNIEGEFCGMSGSNGVTSFSVTYQYSTESPETNTWLFLELVDSEGNTVWDSVPLVQDGIPCV